MLILCFCGRCLDSVFFLYQLFFDLVFSVGYCLPFVLIKPQIDPQFCVESQCFLRVDVLNLAQTSSHLTKARAITVLQGVADSQSVQY